MRRPSAFSRGFGSSKSRLPIANCDVSLLSYLGIQLNTITYRSYLRFELVRGKYEKQIRRKPCAGRGVSRRGMNS